MIDMNLSPDWVNALSTHGWASVHCSAIGDPRATDREIMDWARSNSHVVFTHDLDFGTMLALTDASGPSVIQVRGQNVLPDHMGPIVAAAPKQHQTDLAGVPSSWLTNRTLVYEFFRFDLHATTVAI